MKNPIAEIIKENKRRNDIVYAPFDPITGFSSVGERVEIHIKDFVLPVQWIPIEMMDEPLVKKLIKLGSFDALLESIGSKKEDYATDRDKAIQSFVRLRCFYDFPFWAASLIKIKNKSGGDDVPFILTRPQRKFVAALEEERKANRPIRFVLLKARQWGGSTTSQIYMAWLQLTHKVGLNSLIIAHQGTGSDEIKDMFDKALESYPTEMLHEIGEPYQENEPKMVGVGKSGNIHRVPQRNAKIKIGTAENPDSCRGGAYNLVHLSEVGIWKTTKGKKPEDIVRSACGGILYRPYSMIIYESTANGTGNFFQREYNDAKDPSKKSQFKPLFISWFDIEQYSLEIENIEAFAKELYDNRLNEHAPSDREEPGKYLWWLWAEKGATLEAINWYIHERAKYTDHGFMAAEYPSDDIEAFVHSGARVFDMYKVDALRKSCRSPKYTGDIYGTADEGKLALQGLKFKEDKQGVLEVWELPEEDTEEETIANRYLTVVDIGGRSNKADYSVIVVFDRLFMMEGGKPTVVAQWYGHIDMDILAWKAAQIAAYYNNSLLVIESNTLETHDRERQVDGDQSQYILNQIKWEYPNLYARKQSEEEIREGLPRKYGFHTNIATKPMVISTLVKVVRENLYTERDERCLDEYLCYERRQNGSFGAITGKHDDLLMTRAIGLHICFNEMDLPRIINKTTYHKTAHAAISEATI